MSASTSTSSESPQEAPAIVTQSGFQLLENKILDFTNQFATSGGTGSGSPSLTTSTAPNVSNTVHWIQIIGPNGNPAYIPYWQ